MTEGDSSRVVIRAGSLESRLNYSLSVNGSLSGESGRNQINFTVTGAPYGGNCSIQPTSGKSTVLRGLHFCHIVMTHIMYVTKFNVISIV